PLPVARAAEIQAWIDSGAYQRILGGDYPRRSDDATASVPDDVKQAAESYRESFARSEDPLAKLLRRVGAGAEEIGEWVGAGAVKLRDWVAAAGRSARGAASGQRDDANGGHGQERPAGGGRGHRPARMGLPSRHRSEERRVG